MNSLTNNKCYSKLNVEIFVSTYVIKKTIKKLSGWGENIYGQINTSSNV